MTASLWIFGYGSLLWRPDFPCGPRRPAVVPGWQRRLDQGSPDHRGSPERLGRVATLVPSEARQCVGAVFEVAPDNAGAVLANLDHRERGGYTRVPVRARLLDAPGRVVDAVTWVASRDNPYYLGPAPLGVMVEQITGARGESGSNTEYVLRLVDTLRELEVRDEELERLASALRARCDARVE